MELPEPSEAEAAPVQSTKVKGRGGFWPAAATPAPELPPQPPVQSTKVKGRGGYRGGSVQRRYIEIRVFGFSVVSDIRELSRSSPTPRHQSRTHSVSKFKWWEK